MKYEIFQICLFDTIVALGTRRKELINAYFACERIICTTFTVIFYMYFINISEKKINRKLRVGYFL